MFKGGTRGTPVGKCQTELSGHRWFRGNHQVPFRDKRPPAGEPVGGKLLQEIGKEHGGALGVKKHDLGGDDIAQHQDLIDLPGPMRHWRICQLTVKVEVLALLPQSRRGIEMRVGVGALPIGDEHMMQRIGGDQMTDFPEGVHFRAKPVRQRCRRPNEEVSIGQSHDSHASRIMKSQRRHHVGPIRSPNLGTKFLQHVGSTTTDLVKCRRRVSSMWIRPT